MNVIKLSKKASKRGGDHTKCRKKHSYKASILVLVCEGLCVWGFACVWGGGGGLCVCVCVWGGGWGGRSRVLPHQQSVCPCHFQLVASSTAQHVSDTSVLLRGSSVTTAIVVRDHLLLREQLCPSAAHIVNAISAGSRT